MSRVGVSNFYYAVLTQDTIAGVAYDAPVRIPGLISVSISPASNTNTLYADNGPAEVAESLGEVTVEVDLKDLTIEHQSALLGHTSSGGIMVSAAGDVAPYVAILFEGLKANGKKKFVKLLKGKFAIPNDSYETKKDNVTFQTDKISGKFVIRDFDSKWKYTAEEDAADYVASVGANWFTSVEAGADVVAPTVACVPTDGASGVSADADVVLTFSEAMTASSLVDGESFVLQKNDGTQVAGAGTWNTGHTVYTFNPTASLSAGTYNVIVTKAVKDLAGNALAAVNEFTFTV